MRVRFYCPNCSDGNGNHPALVVGEHQGFGNYYAASCRNCNDHFEIPAHLVENGETE